MGDTGCRFNRIPSQIRGVHTATSWIRLLILETKVPRQKLERIKGAHSNYTHKNFIGKVKFILHPGTREVDWCSIRAFRAKKDAHSR